MVQHRAVTDLSLSKNVAPPTPVPLPGAGPSPTPPLALIPGPAVAAVSLCGGWTSRTGGRFPLLSRDYTWPSQKGKAMCGIDACYFI